MKIKVTRFYQRVEGERYPLYLATMPVEDLLQVAKVDVQHATENPTGYQRKPGDSRFRALSKYIRAHEGLLPTAILVNVRSESAKFQSEDGNAGVVSIPAGEPVWIVDGQHRLFGLKRAIEDLRSEDPDAELGYEVPVVFTLGFDQFEEMELFSVVNGKQKSVPTDLAADLLRSKVLAEGRGFVRSGRGNEAEFRKAVGASVARYLNDVEGPWQGKIRLPNEAANRKLKPLQLNSIASSLDTVLKDQYVRGIYEGETSKEWPRLRSLILTYWKALASLMPEAVADIEHHSLQRTVGTYVFHLILPDVIYRARDKADFSQESFEEILSGLGEWVTSQQWHTEDGDPITRATGMSSIRELAEILREKLPPVATPGL